MTAGGTASHTLRQWRSWQPLRTRWLRRWTQRDSKLVEGTAGGIGGWVQRRSGRLSEL